MVGTLNSRINPRHPSNVKASGGSSNIRSVEEDVEQGGERWGVVERTSTLEHLLDPTKVPTLSKFNRSTDRDCQDLVDVLRSRVSVLFNTLRCLLPNILDNVPTTPATGNYQQTQCQRSTIPSR